MLGVALCEVPVCYLAAHEDYESWIVCRLGAFSDEVTRQSQDYFDSLSYLSQVKVKYE